MSNIDKRALRERAESTIGILENIAGFEPSDIDGDAVELRFETEGGFDTGCDVSIVDQCQKAADVVRALLNELEAKDKRLAELTEKPIGWTDEQELLDVEKLGCGYLFNANPITSHADPRRVILLYAAAADKGEAS